MKITFSWDDGALEDLKLIELHNKYQIPGMFFVPTINKEGRGVLAPKDIEHSASELISFGGHTEHHVYLTEIPLSSVKSEVANNRKYLEDILGSEIKHFCLPGGKYNADILKEVYGEFQTIRTADTMCCDAYGKLIKPTFHIYPRGKKSLFLNSMRNRNVMAVNFLLTHPSLNYWDTVTEYINTMQYQNLNIVIWGHSWEIDQYDLWNHVENLFKLVTQSEKQYCVSYENLCGVCKGETL